MCAASDEPNLIRALPRPDRTEPHTERGKRTRDALVSAAREVFERDGFLNARVTDISAAAHVAHGTFYTYFDSKEEIFIELAVQLLGEMLGSGPNQSPLGNVDKPMGPMPGPSDNAGQPIAPTVGVKIAEDPIGAIRRANRRYLDAYRRNAELMGIIEHVAMFNAELGVIREARARSFSDRAERSIADLQAVGLADPALDPRQAATALTGMVSRFAYAWFVAASPGPEGIDFDQGVETVTRLWANAIGLSERLDRRRRPQP